MKQFRIPKSNYFHRIIFSFVLFSAPNSWVQAQENIDLTHELSPSRDQAESAFCHSYVASDLLTYHFKEKLKGERLSALDIATTLLNHSLYRMHGFVSLEDLKSHISNVVGEKFVERDEKFHLAVQAETRRQTQEYYNSYMKNWTNIFNRKSNVEYALRALNHKGQACLEKDFTFHDNQVPAYKAHFLQHIESVKNYLGEWQELATAKGAAELTCRKPIVLPKVVVRTLDWRGDKFNTTTKMNSIYQLLESRKLMSILFNLKGLTKFGYNSLHLATLAGIKLENGIAYLAVRNHVNEKCVFKETSHKKCFNGVEWIAAETILPKITRVEYVE